MAKKLDENNLRFDLKIIASWIEPGSRILDLGCGEGDLLNYLKKNKQIIGTGIENSEEMVMQSMAKGLTILHGDITEEILDYPGDYFDYVILSRTLQQVFAPESLIKAILKIGKKAVVSFPNFSHWLGRFQLFFKGQAPITKQLPYTWYNTPNIRVITLKDFRRFSNDTGFKILKEVAINMHERNKRDEITRFLPDFRATHGIFLIGKL